MPDRSSHWAELLTPQTTEAFYIGYGGGAIGRRQSLIESVFSVRTSARAFEQHQGAGVFGSDGWNLDGPNGGGRVKYDQRNKGFLTTFTHAQFAKGFIVERKLVDDNLFDIITDDASALGDSAFRKREKSAAGVLNNAFTSSTNDDGFSTLGADGVVLCSASHKRSADDTGTQSNAGTTALSKDAVGTTRVTMQKFTDDRGDLMDVMADGLIVPPELEDTASTITKSLMDPTSANNAINPQNGRFSTLVWHYLSDANNWFMVDSVRKNQMLLWYERIPLEFGREPDFETLHTKFRAYNRYSYGWKDWAWVYGHVVA